MVKISFIYVAIMALIFVALSLRVVRHRFSTKVSLGDGGHSKLNIAIRTHGNFSEYIPLALLLMMGVEVLNYSSQVIHALGVVLILGRLAHVYGLSAKKGLSIYRPIGMISTFLMMILSSVLILLKSF